MLPPDTASTLLPWRVVVAAMQLQGCFPFRMSATSGLPTFSLPLCLWSVFAFLLRMALLCSTTKEYVLQNLSLDVGTILYLCMGALLSVCLCLIPIAMGVRSAWLARLLHDLSEVSGVSPPHTHRWYWKPQTLIFMFCVIAFLAISTRDVVQMGFTSVGFNVALLATNILSLMDFMLPEEVLSMVAGLLGCRLLAATEATAATLSVLLAHDGSFKIESDMEAAMLQLRDLDGVIREVRGESTVGG